MVDREWCGVYFFNVLVGLCPGCRVVRDRWCFTVFGGDGVVRQLFVALFSVELKSVGGGPWRVWGGCRGVFDFDVGDHEGVVGAFRLALGGV